MNYEGCKRRGENLAFFFFLSFVLIFSRRETLKKIQPSINMQKGFDCTSNSYFQSQQSHTNCNGIKTHMERKHPHYIPFITVRRIEAHKCYSVPYSIESVWSRELRACGACCFTSIQSSDIVLSYYMLMYPNKNVLVYVKTKERTNLDIHFFIRLIERKEILEISTSKK